MGLIPVRQLVVTKLYFENNPTQVQKPMQTSIYIRMFFSLWVTFCYSLNVIGSELDSLAVKNIVIAADEWCPYNCIPGSEKPGYMVEIAREAFGLEGSAEYSVSYKKLPWIRAIKMAQQGQIAGIIGAIESEAEGLHVPVEEQGRMYAKFFSTKGSNWQYRNISSLDEEGVILGAISGYDYDEEIANYIVGNPSKVYLSHGDTALPELIRVLNYSRIQVLIEDEAVFWYNVSKLGFKSDDCRVAGTTSEPQKLFIAFGNKMHAKILSDGVKKLRKSGRLQAILKKYNLVDWKIKSAP